MARKRRQRTLVRGKGPLGFTISGDFFGDAVRDAYDPAAYAATAAMREVAQEVQAQGRADIGSAGFPPRWRNAFRASAYPRGRKQTVNAVAYTNMKSKRGELNFASVFETGATIHGKPTLWVPAPGVPEKIGGKRINPRMFARVIGKLQYVRANGKQFLFAKVGGRSGRITAASLRSGATTGGQSKPVFIGLDAVKLRKRFNIGRIIDFARIRLSTLYYKHLKS